MAADAPKITRALISVSDKAGLVELGKALAGMGIEVLSTGGTSAALKAAGIAVKDVAEQRMLITRPAAEASTCSRSSVALSVAP